MANEKRWEMVPPRAFTANGTLDGIITVADASGFFAKQVVTIKSNTQIAINAEVRVVTPTTIQVGAIGSNFSTYLDIEDFLVVDNSSIEASEQIKTAIKPDNILQAIYERDPAVAIRALLVDKFGGKYDTNNPMPTINVGDVVHSDWDDLILTRDSNTQDITNATWLLNGNVVESLDLIYDENENVIEVKKV